MYRNPDVFQRIAVVVPVHFSPEEDAGLIRGILEKTFLNQGLACPRENILAVVDIGTAAEEIFKSASSESALFGIKVHTLQKNRCKAGAVREGLEILLQETSAEYFTTRDCDGDHFVEDMPRMVDFLAHASKASGNRSVCIMGSRASLEKPMGWVRQEWERLTNDILTGMISLKMGESGRVMDQRFWNGCPPDIQSGYRVYSREAAATAVSGLLNLPEERAILNFACEFEPFVDITLNGGFFCQVNRLTLVEQPVSSYRNADFALDYGSYLKHAGSKMKLHPEGVLQLADNALSRSPLFYTDHRHELLQFREILAGSNGPGFFQAPFA